MSSPSPSPSASPRPDPRSTSVTVSTTGLLVAALAVLALVVAYLLGGGGDAPPAQAAPTTAAPGTASGETSAGPGTLTMTGSGEATVVPDQVGFDVAVRVKRPELDEALDAANRATARVLEALEAQGVRPRDVQTTGLEMYPVYDYPRYSPPVLTGYRVTQRAAVLVTELARAGDAVNAAVTAGAGAARVSDIALRVGDPQRGLAQARQAAVEEATLKAQEYAEATGQNLGAVVTLREVRETAASAIDGQALETASYAARDLADRASLPVRAGRADLGVTVQVVWSLTS